MNTDRPHEIVRFPEHLGRSRPPTAWERKWLPLTEAEAERLERMSEDQRAEWFGKLGIEEKLRRYAIAEGIIEAANEATEEQP